MINSLRQEVLVPSLLQWGEEQQELLPGFEQRILRLLSSSQPSNGEGVGRMRGKWLPFWKFGSTTSDPSQHWNCGAGRCQSRGSASFPLAWSLSLVAVGRRDQLYRRRAVKSLPAMGSHLPHPAQLLEERTRWHLKKWVEAPGRSGTSGMVPLALQGTWSSVMETVGDGLGLFSFGNVVARQLFYTL